MTVSRHAAVRPAGLRQDFDRPQDWKDALRQGAKGAWDRGIDRLTRAQVVNGPEILSKFVGESEQNIRKLFKEAEEEYLSRGDDSELHVIIFDEIDAICKSAVSREVPVDGGAGSVDPYAMTLVSETPW